VRSEYNYNEELGLLLRKSCRVCGCSDAPTYSHHNEGYLVIRVAGKNQLMHRMVWLYLHGSIPEGKEIDHIDGDRTNNRAENLRAVDRRNNARNSSLRSDNTSGAVGVYWGSKDKRWKAQISCDGVVKALGSFKLKEDAINARKRAEVALGFHRNHGKRGKI
jgi:hypothetical protein